LIIERNKKDEGSHLGKIKNKEKAEHGDDSS